MTALPRMSSVHDEVDQILAAVAAKSQATADLFRSDFKRWTEGGGDPDAALKGLRQGARKLGVQIPSSTGPAPVVSRPAPTLSLQAPARPGASVSVSEQPGKGKREPRTAPIEYKAGGYHNVPNLMTDNLLDVIPGPVLKAYIFCTRISDADGSFHVAHSTLARKIGAKDRRHGERVMRRLLDAGLVRQRWRGGPGRSNGYALAGLAAMDFESTRKVLAQPLTPHRSTGPVDRPYTGPAEGMSTGPADPTTQT